MAGEKRQASREVGYVQWLHRPEQSLPERLIPTAEHQHLGGRNVRVSSVELHGRLLGLQSDQDAPFRPPKSCFQDRHCELLQCGHAIQFEKCLSYLQRLI